MKIKVIETGAIREIEIIDYRTGKDVSADVVALADCEERWGWSDDGEMVMPEYAADWWTEYADGYATTEAEINEISESLGNLSENEQAAILGKFRQSGICLRGDVSNYVYEENLMDLDSQRSIAEIRIKEIREAIWKHCGKA